MTRGRPRSLRHLKDQGASVIEFRQTVANFSEPTKELEALMRAGKIAHDGNPALTWMIGNVVGHYDAKDNVYPRKERSENKIDGAIALIMAFARNSLKCALSSGACFKPIAMMSAIAPSILFADRSLRG